MIAEIQSPKEDMTQSINYNFEKIDKGKGYIIGSNMAEEFQNKKEFKPYLLEVISQNKKIKKQDLNIRHISISLAPGEHLNDNVFLELTEEYLEKLGYQQTPYIVFRHTDTDKEHLHILVSQVDFDGVRITDSKERFRSFEVSRQLEKQFNIKSPEMGIEKDNTPGIDKKNKYTLTRLYQKLSLENQDKIKSKYININFEEIKNLSNQQLNLILGPDFLKFESDIKLLSESKDKVYNKENLIKKLDEIRKHSKNGLDFINKVKNDDTLYIRKVFNKKGEPSYMYGLKDKVYLKHGQYPNRFNLYSINNYKNSVEKTFTEVEQRTFLRTGIRKALRESNSFETLETELLNRKIKLDYLKNTKGEIKGIKFTSLSIKNPITFGGSKISKELSYNQLSNLFNSPSKKNNSVVRFSSSYPLLKKDYQYLEQNSNALYSNLIVSNDSNNELERWNRKNKKKKKKGRGKN